MVIVIVVFYYTHHAYNVKEKIENFIFAENNFVRNPVNKKNMNKINGFHFWQRQFIFGKKIAENKIIFGKIKIGYYNIIH